MSIKPYNYWIMSLLLLTACSETPDIASQLSRDCYSHYKAKSYKVALSVCEKSAEQGNSRAMWYMGTMYYYGLGKQGKNAEKSFAWYLRAAEAGLTQAQRIVGESYLYADGVEENFELAYQWLSDAAKQQDRNAEFAIAMMFLEGKGREKDLSSAIAWFKRAASQRHRMATNNLAWIYATSAYKSYRNAKKALFWANQLPVPSETHGEAALAKAAELDSSLYLYLDTQAAAYALSEAFEQAVERQQQAIAWLPDTLTAEELSGYQQRLAFYQQKKAWVDETMQ